MTAAARRTPSANIPVPSGTVTPLRAEVSSRSLAAQTFGRGRACDPLAFGMAFPDRWMAFLHAHFRGPVEVAFFFGVTEKAAQKWWQGIGGPQGAKVAYAAQHYPEATIHYLFAAE